MNMDYMRSGIILLLAQAAWRGNSQSATESANGVIVASLRASSLQEEGLRMQLVCLQL
jgi:hypothetical protein